LLFLVGWLYSDDVDLDNYFLNLQPSKKSNFLNYKNQKDLKNLSTFRLEKNFELPTFKGFSSWELVESWRTWKKPKN